MATADTITVLVGADEVKWTFPSSELTKHSEFFRKALQGSWKEAKERVVRLPDIEEDMFQAYEEWVSKGTFKVLSEDIVADEERLEVLAMAITDCSFNTMIRFWITADQLGDVELCNAINDNAKEFFEEICEDGDELEDEDIELAWDNTTEDATIRRLLMDVLMIQYDPDDVFESSSKLGREFEVAMFKRAVLLAVNQGGGTFRHSLCDYHEHNERVMPHALCYKRYQ